MVDEPTFDVIGMYETHSRGEITDYILHTYAADGVTAGELEDCFAQIEALKAEGQGCSRPTRSRTWPAS